MNAVEADVVTAEHVRAKFFECPECHEQFEAPEGLGSHLERHREITPPAPLSKRGKPRSLPCPKGCGRHFKRLTTSEARAHLLLCDGSEPLIVIEKTGEEERMAKLECPKCGKKYQRGGSRYEKHVAQCGDQEEAAEKEESSQASESMAGGGGLDQLLKADSEISVKDHVLGMLETLEEHYEGKLKDVKILIAAVRNASERGDA